VGANIKLRRNEAEATGGGTIVTESGSGIVTGIEIGRSAETENETTIASIARHDETGAPLQTANESENAETMTNATATAANGDTRKTVTKTIDVGKNAMVEAPLSVMIENATVMLILEGDASRRFTERGFVLILTWISDSNISAACTDMFDLRNYPSIAPKFRPQFQ